MEIVTFPQNFHTKKFLFHSMQTLYLCGTVDSTYVQEHWTLLCNIKKSFLKRTKGTQCPLNAYDVGASVIGTVCPGPKGVFRSGVHRTRYIYVVLLHSMYYVDPSNLCIGTQIGRRPGFPSSPFPGVVTQTESNTLPLPQAPSTGRGEKVGEKEMSDAAQAALALLIKVRYSGRRLIAKRIIDNFG